MLQQIHGSGCRCMLECVSLNFGQSVSDFVKVNGTLVFFEHQAQTFPVEKTVQVQRNAGAKDPPS